MINTKKVLFLSLFLIIGLNAFSQTLPPPAGPPNPPVPIAEAIIGLFVAGAIYGAKKLKE
jgi:hypothetical protein